MNPKPRTEDEELRALYEEIGAEIDEALAEILSDQDLERRSDEAYIIARK